MLDSNPNVGPAVKHYRKKAGLNQEKLAILTGVHHTYISMIENQHRDPKLSTVQNIAQALDVSVFTLLDFNIPKSWVNPAFGDIHLKLNRLCRATKAKDKLNAALHNIAICVEELGKTERELLPVSEPIRGWLQEFSELETLLREEIQTGVSENE